MFVSGLERTRQTYWCVDLFVTRIAKDDSLPVVPERRLIEIQVTEIRRQGSINKQREFLSGVVKNTQLVGIET